MRRTLSLLLMLAASLPLAAVDRWILISGTVGVFHTDARVFNPSFDKDIVLSARLLPAGNPAVDNHSRETPTATFTVPKRSQHILNDVTSVLFNSTSLGAILFTSADPFEVTSRIYAQTPNGTLGQFGPGLAPSLARTKGAIVQMKSNGGAGQVGTFRTNIGVVNTATTNTTITWRLYDKNNTLVTSHEMTMPPLGVTTPIGMADAFFWGSTQSGADLSDSWVSFTASNPIFAYASVLDNGTTDQTFIAALEDVGVAPAQPPPAATTHTFDVRLEDFSITFSPAPIGIEVGDTVRLRIRRVEGAHGFQMTGPRFTNVVPNTVPSGSAVVERTFVAATAGTYTYFCTVTTCGEGHNFMTGDFQVGSENTGPGY